MASESEPAGRKTGHKTLWAWTVATWFGAGLLKPAPGTWGSLAAVALWALFAWGTHATPTALWIALLAGIVVSIALGVPAATIAARESGREDPGFVVVDEVAGQWIALLFVPPLWTNALLALLFFRFFDILKPWPIRRLEALPEGTGIMLDDLAAGVLALVFTQVSLYLLLRVY